MMPDCALPVRFAECREFAGKEGSYENTMVGLIRRLDRPGVYKDTLEKDFLFIEELRLAR